MPVMENLVVQALVTYVCKHLSPPLRCDIVVVRHVIKHRRPFLVCQAASISCTGIACAGTSGKHPVVRVLVHRYGASDDGRHRVGGREGGGHSAAVKSA